MTTSSACSVQILGKESSGFVIQPLNSKKRDLYYYKISVRDLDPQLAREICATELKHEYLCAKGIILLADFQDYARALLLFERNIVQVSGPVSEEHLQILLSNHYCVIRPHAWYRQYDAKVELYSYRATRTDFQNRTQELINNIGPAYKVMTVGYRSMAVYTQLDQAELLVAMCRLSFPQQYIRSFISRCVIWKS